MTDLELEEILSGFAGNDQQNIDYFLSISEKYKEDPEANHIYNAALQTLYKCLSNEARQKFIDGLEENGLTHLLKTTPVEIHRLDKEDIVEVKKFIIGNSAGVKQIKCDFDKAVLVGQPLVMSVPKEVVERLIQQRKEWLEKNENAE